MPADCYEDELAPIFERAGHLLELRLKLDAEGRNRGYGFALYAHSDEARRAVRSFQCVRYTPQVLAIE